jgi:gliding motility-associated-like protein
MNLILKIISLFFTVLWLTFPAKANHVIGGNLSWSCLGNGQYVFEVNLTVECSTSLVAPTQQQIGVWNHPTIAAIPINFINETDLSPTCNQVAGGSAILTCANQSVGSLKKYTYQSSPINVSGVPPTQGYQFTYSQSSRSNLITNIQPGSGITLHAAMYAYNGLNADPCYDSSPSIAIDSYHLFCVGSSNEIVVGGYDVNGDSLVYSFSEPLNNNITTTFQPGTQPSNVTWATGYSLNQCLPSSTMQANNVGPILNNENGEVVFETYNIGQFLMKIKVESFRCGIKIAEINNEIIIQIANCTGSNNAPSISLNSNNFSVFAGDTVNVSVQVNDNDLLQDGTNQEVETYVQGSFLSSIDNSIGGCSQLPCPQINTSNPSVSNGLSTIDFSWVTSCDHVSQFCINDSKLYYFHVSAKDNYCSIPKYANESFSVEVKNVNPVASPSIKCLQVDNNGDVLINWVPASDTMNSFQEYQFYYSNGTGNYSLIGSENNINANSFIHTGANANSQSLSYYLITVSGCGGAYVDYSDTLETIYISVNNPSNGTAVLQWNHPLPVATIPSNARYLIEKEYPANFWTIIDTVNTSGLNYIDTVTTCDAYLNFRISLYIPGNCNHVSNIDGDQFQDQLPPSQPTLSSVSIDSSSGHMIVNWGASNSDDTYAYIIQQFSGGVWSILDTVYGANSVFYIDTNTINYYNSIVQYAVAAMDSCLPQPNTSSVGLAHQNMVLSKDYNVCELSVELNWNEYINWTNGVQQYEIYYSIDGVNWSLLSSTNSTTFYFDQLSAELNYSFLVKAVENNGVFSFSNIIELYSKQPPSPQFSYLSSVNVIDGFIEVSYHADQSVSVMGYNLFRSDDNGISFELIDQDLSLSYPVLFIDEQVDVNQQNYLYKISVTDSCLRDVAFSNIGSSIYLDEVPDEWLVNSFNWSNYAKWENGVEHYDVLTKNNLNSVFQTLTNVDSSTLSYSEDISNYIGTLSNGEFCYQIAALENQNSYGFKSTSLSNELCINKDPKVYVPNALVVSGINNNWKPVVNLIDFNNYNVQIYNRLGQLVFETNDYAQGWDGTILNSNALAPLGVYLYMIEFQNGRGDFLRKQGHITVVR